MSPSDPQDERWHALQLGRDERMRFEVLSMLYEAAGRCVDFPVDVRGFVRRLGVWERELDRILLDLDEKGYVRYERTPESVSVCITVEGVGQIVSERQRREKGREGG